MVWEDVEFLGDVGSRLKHVLNNRPVHRLSNLLSPSLSPSPKDMRRREEYFDVEGDKKEFVMAKKVVPCTSAITTLSDGKCTMVANEAMVTTTTTTTTQLLFPTSPTSNEDDIMSEESIFFPCYDHLPSTVLSPQPITSTFASDIQQDICSSPPTSSTDNIQFQESFISFSNDTVDDTYLQHPPTMHVDYLSHEWREEDISASWRFTMSNGHREGEEFKRSRLLNALWRRWGKTRFNLGTLPAEEIDWIKDDDLTWLYGPIHTRRTLSLDLDAPRCSSFVDTDLPPHPTRSLPQAGILRVPTLEEVLRRGSALELASNRHLPPSSLDSSRSSLPSRSNSTRSRTHESQPSSANDSSDESSPGPKRKSVSFHDQVFQARKVSTHRDSDERIMTKRELRESRNVSNETQRHPSAPLLHRPISPTSLALPGRVLPRAGESSHDGTLGVLGSAASYLVETARPGNVVPHADAPITKPLVNSQTFSYQKSLKKAAGPKAAIRDAASRGREKVSSVASTATSVVRRSLSLESSKSCLTQSNIPDGSIKASEREQQESHQPATKPKEQQLQSPKAYRPWNDCVVMSTTISTPMPMIEILTDDELFEFEMFGLPQPTAQIKDLDVQSDISSTISDTSSEDLDFSPVVFDSVGEGEVKMPVVSFNNYPTNYDIYSDSTIVREQPQFVPSSCSTKARGFGGSGAFEVQMPMVAEPMRMDDEEEYWFMNV